VLSPHDLINLSIQPDGYRIELIERSDY